MDSLYNMCIKLKIVGKTLYSLDYVQASKRNEDYKKYTLYIFYNVYIVLLERVLNLVWFFLGLFCIQTEFGFALKQENWIHICGKRVSGLLWISIDL